MYEPTSSFWFLQVPLCVISLLRFLRLCGEQAEQPAFHIAVALAQAIAHVPFMTRVIRSSLFPVLTPLLASPSLWFASFGTNSHFIYLMKNELTFHLEGIN